MERTMTFRGDLANSLWESDTLRNLEVRLTISDHLTRKLISSPSSSSSSSSSSPSSTSSSSSSSSSSFHHLDMTLAVAEALNPNKPKSHPGLHKQTESQAMITHLGSTPVCNSHCPSRTCSIRRLVFLFHYPTATKGVPGTSKASANSHYPLNCAPVDEEGPGIL